MRNADFSVTSAGELGYAFRCNLCRDSENVYPVRWLKSRLNTSLKNPK